MNFLKRLLTAPLIVVFILVIFTVPITQAIVELRKGKSVQALDLLEDLTITPFRNANAAYDLACRASLYTDSLAVKHVSTDSSQKSSDLLVDDAITNVEDLKKTVISKNRYITTDSLIPAVFRLDTLAARLARFATKLHAGAPAVEIAVDVSAMRAATDMLIKEYPKRSIIALPLLAIGGWRYILWNDRYLRPYEKELENSSAFAIAGRPLMQFLRYLLFRDLGEKGVLGTRGWFFYRPDVDFLVKPDVLDPRSIMVDPNDKKISEDPLRAIVRFKTQLQSAGIDLLMVIMPGKPSIYPDLLARGITVSAAGSISHSQRMMNDLRQAGVDVLDLFGPFAKERLRDAEAGDSLYLREDTHWKGRAVRLAARLLAERIKQYPWYRPGSTEYAVDSVTVDRIGDVAVMTTLPAEKVHRFYGGFIPEKTKCYQVYHITRDASGAVSERSLYKDDYRNSQVLLLGDSFSRIYQTDEPKSAGWIAHLAFELSQPIASLVNDGGASTLVRQSLARNPKLLKGKKLVIWEVVERDFRFGEDGWKDVAIAMQ
jgi:hypothetical protein